MGWERKGETEAGQRLLWSSGSLPAPQPGTQERLPRPRKRKGLRQRTGGHPHSVPKMPGGWSSLLHPDLVSPGEARPGRAGSSEGPPPGPWALTHLWVVGELKGPLRGGVQLGHAHCPHHGGWGRRRVTPQAGLTGSRASAAGAHLCPRSSHRLRSLAFAMPIGRRPLGGGGVQTP